MRRNLKIVTTLVFGLLIAGCSINVDEHGVHRYADYYDGSRGDYEFRRISIEQPFDSRAAAGTAMDRTMDALRAAGCDVISADRWHSLHEREGPDVNGMRVVASCPDSAGIPLPRPD